MNIYSNQKVVTNGYSLGGNQQTTFSSKLKIQSTKEWLTGLNQSQKMKKKGFVF